MIKRNDKSRIGVTQKKQTETQANSSDQIALLRVRNANITPFKNTGLSVEKKLLDKDESRNWDRIRIFGLHLANNNPSVNENLSLPPAISNSLSNKEKTKSLNGNLNLNYFRQKTVAPTRPHVFGDVPFYTTDQNGLTFPVPLSIRNLSLNVHDNVGKGRYSSLAPGISQTHKGSQLNTKQRTGIHSKTKKRKSKIKQKIKTENNTKQNIQTLSNTKEILFQSWNKSIFEYKLNAKEKIEPQWSKKQTIDPLPIINQNLESQINNNMDEIMEPHTSTKENLIEYEFNSNQQTEPQTNVKQKLENESQFIIGKSIIGSQSSSKQKIDDPLSLKNKFEAQTFAKQKIETQSITKPFTLLQSSTKQNVEPQQSSTKQKIHSQTISKQKFESLMNRKAKLGPQSKNNTKIQSHTISKQKFESLSNMEQKIDFKSNSKQKIEPHTTLNTKESPESHSDAKVDFLSNEKQKLENLSTTKSKVDFHLDEKEKVEVLNAKSKFDFHSDTNPKVNLSNKISKGDFHSDSKQKEILSGTKSIADFHLGTKQIDNLSNTKSRMDFHWDAKQKLEIPSNSKQKIRYPKQKIGTLPHDKQEIESPLDEKNRIELDSITNPKIQFPLKSILKKAPQRLKTVVEESSSSTKMVHSSTDSKTTSSIIKLKRAEKSEEPPRLNKRDPKSEYIAQMKKIMPKKAKPHEHLQRIGNTDRTEMKMDSKRAIKCPSTVAKNILNSTSSHPKIRLGKSITRSKSRMATDTNSNLADIKEVNNVNAAIRDLKRFEQLQENKSKSSRRMKKISSKSNHALLNKSKPLSTQSSKIDQDDSNNRKIINDKEEHELNSGFCTSSTESLILSPAIKKNIRKASRKGKFKNPKLKLESESDIAVAESARKITTPELEKYLNSRQFASDPKKPNGFTVGKRHKPLTPVSPGTLRVKDSQRLWKECNNAEMTLHEAWTILGLQSSYDKNCNSKLMQEKYFGSLNSKEFCQSRGKEMKLCSIIESLNKSDLIALKEDGDPIGDNIEKLLEKYGVPKSKPKIPKNFSYKGVKDGKRKSANNRLKPCKSIHYNFLKADFERDSDTDLTDSFENSESGSLTDLKLECKYSSPNKVIAESDYESEGYAEFDICYSGSDTEITTRESCIPDPQNKIIFEPEKSISELGKENIQESENEIISKYEKDFLESEDDIIPKSEKYFTKSGKEVQGPEKHLSVLSEIEEEIIPESKNYVSECEDVIQNSRKNVSEAGKEIIQEYGPYFSESENEIIQNQNESGKSRLGIASQGDCCKPIIGSSDPDVSCPDTNSNDEAAEICTENEEERRYDECYEPPYANSDNRIDSRKLTSHPIVIGMNPSFTNCKDDRKQAVMPPFDIDSEDSMDELANAYIDPFFRELCTRRCKLGSKDCSTQDDAISVEDTVLESENNFDPNMEYCAYNNIDISTLKNKKMIYLSFCDQTDANLQISSMIYDDEDDLSDGVFDQVSHVKDDKSYCTDYETTYDEDSLSMKTGLNCNRIRNSDTVEYYASAEEKLSSNPSMDVLLTNSESCKEKVGNSDSLKNPEEFYEYGKIHMVLESNESVGSCTQESSIKKKRDIRPRFGGTCENCKHKELTHKNSKEISKTGENCKSLSMTVLIDEKEVLTSLDLSPINSKDDLAQQNENDIKKKCCISLPAHEETENSKCPTEEQKNVTQKRPCFRRFCKWCSRVLTFQK